MQQLSLFYWFGKSVSTAAKKRPAPERKAFRESGSNENELIALPLTHKGAPGAQCTRRADG